MCHETDVNNSNSPPDTNTNIKIALSIV